MLIDATERDAAGHAMLLAPYPHVIAAVAERLLLDRHLTADAVAATNQSAHTQEEIHP